MKKINSTIRSVVLTSVFGLFGLGALMAQITVNMQWTAGTFPAEDGWEVYNTATNAVVFCEPAGGAVPPANTNLNLAAGNYTVRGYDSFGDGWNGSILRFFQGPVQISGNLTLAGGGFTNSCPGFVQTGTILGNFNVVAPTCVITCPANITVDNDPGECGADVDIPAPQTSTDCAGAPAGVVSLQGPSTPLLYNTLGLITTPTTVSGATATAVPAFPVTISIQFTADADFVTESFTVTGPNGAVLGAFNSMGQCNNTTRTTTVTAATWNGWVGTYGSNLTFTVLTDADVDNICANQNWSVAVSYPTSTVPAVNDYNGTGNASDFYPVGTTDVTFTTFDATGFPSSCTMTVTVEDTEPPTFDPCPSDIVVNLGPGECEDFVNFTVEAIDNCPFQGPLTSLIQYNDPAVATTNPPGSLACYIAPTSYWRVYNLPASGITTDFLVQSISMGLVNANNNTVTVRVHQLNGAFTLANLTLLGAKTTQVTGSGIYATIPFDTPVLVPAGSTFVVEIALTPVAPFGFLGQNTNGESAPSYLSAPACGLAAPGTFASVGFPTYVALFHPNGNIFLNEIPVMNMSDVNPLTGLPYASGDQFPIGVTNMKYTATDANGLSNTCEFTIEVLEFANPIQSLACNDLVQISLDENGQAVIGADQILEGGPYGCYDDYIVEVLNQFGGSIGNTVDCSHVGPTWTVRVTDPDTDNKCWGEIVVEDKLPPVLECPNFSILCTEDPDNLPLNIPFGGTLALDSGPRPAFDAPNNVLIDYPVTAIPGVAQVTDVNLYVRINHTWVADLQVTLIGPNGVTRSVFSGQCGTADNVDATFDDEGVAFACTANPAISGVRRPAQSFDVFDGINPSGTWQVRVADVAGGDMANIINIQLQISYTSVYPGTVASDNCSVVSLTYDDVVDNGNCDGPSGTILRNWTAVDPSGNSSTCQQQITVIRPTLADVSVPPHYDGIDAPAFQCDNDPFWDFNGNGYPDATIEEAGVPTIGGLPFTNGDWCNLASNFTDEVIPVCAGTTKYIRHWVLLDWCTGESVTYDQVIKVIDDEGPEVVCPNPDNGPVVINVYQASAPANNGPHEICTGVVNIPPVEVIGDACSGIDADASLTEIWTPGAGEILFQQSGNGGSFSGVELIADNPFNNNNAVYTVRHRIYDNCGNVTDCLYDIVVVDKVPPVPICDEITELSLTNNGPSGEGCSVLHAEVLDDGSYDNCGDVYFYVAKMNPFLPPPYFYQYYPSVEFCCDEVGDNMVVVLVLDFDPTQVPGATLPDGSIFLFPGNQVFEGSFNTCMVTVEVTDKIPPVTIFCPEDVEMSCDEYLENYAAQVAQGNYDVLDVFGEAQFYDNCQADSVYDVNVNLDACTEGTITRTWTASDGNGSATCTQTIFIYHVSDWVVEFPADVTAICTDGQLPDTGEPEIFFDECELIGTSHEDQIFYIVPDACYKIERTWTVINWCVYDDFGYDAYAEVSELNLPGFQDWDGDGDDDERTFRDGWNSTGTPGTPDGYIKWKQIIKVIDEEAPEFTIPAIDGCIVDTDCDTDITLPYPDINDDCSPTFDVDITGDFGDFDDITGDVTIAEVVPGEYEVTYAVTDNCGNTSYQTITVVVEDCKKPTPYCKNLVVEIMQTGMVEVWAVDFDNGSFDNCGPVKLSFSPDVNDISAVFTCDDLGTLDLELWVTDGTGNQDFCVVQLNLQDNMGHCNSVTVAGTITTETTNPVEGVEVEVNGGMFGQTTGANGAFSFTLPNGGDYTITPSLDLQPDNGVTTWDLVLVSRHILQIQLLDSPYKVIAADANKSNTVSTLDMVQIRKVILQIEPNFPGNTSWRFVDKDYVFPASYEPLPAFPEVINFNNLNADQLFADFYAVKVGDVNNSAAANSTMDAEERTFNGALVMNVEDQDLKAGKTYEVAFTADAIDLLGYQFTLNFDNQALELVELVPGVAQAENFGLTLLNEGAITASWNTADVRNLNAGEVLFTLVFKANADVTLSEIMSINSRFTAAEAYNGNSELLDVQLGFNGQVAAAGFELYQNIPNPFKGVTSVGFNLPEASFATLKVMDATGKVLDVIRGDFAKGYNEVRISGINATGVLYYQLETAGFTATKKMIILE